MKHARKVKIKGEIWKYFVQSKYKYDDAEVSCGICNAVARLTIYTPDNKQIIKNFNYNIRITPAMFKQKILNGEWSK